MEHFERIALEETDKAEVVLGLCPGCELWQVDYTHEVQQQYVTLKRVPNGVVSSNAAAMFSAEPDLSEWYELIEDVMAEHLMQCPHLQRLLVDR